MARPMTVNCGVDGIECPECGAKRCWQDVLTDGCLEVGYEDGKPCSCGATLVIVAVEWEPTITVESKMPEPDVKP